MTYLEYSENMKVNRWYLFLTGPGRAGIISFQMNFDLKKTQMNRKYFHMSNSYTLRHSPKTHGPEGPNRIEY